MESEALRIVASVAHDLALAVMLAGLASVAGILWMVGRDRL